MGASCLSGGLPSDTSSVAHVTDMFSPPPHPLLTTIHGVLGMQHRCCVTTSVLITFASAQN